MFSLSKYKLMMAVAGTAAGSYGSYELYNFFGPLATSVANSEESRAFPAQEVKSIIEPMSTLSEPVVINHEPEEKEIVEEEEVGSEEENPKEGSEVEIVVVEEESQEPASPVVESEEELDEDFDEDEKETIEELPEVPSLEPAPSQSPGWFASISSRIRGVVSYPYKLWKGETAKN